MKKYKIPDYFTKNSKALGILIIFLIFLINFTSFTTLVLNVNHCKPEYQPKMSWFWATLDLTNPSEVNNTRFYHNSPISVKGRVYNVFNESIDTSGLNVAIEVDDVVDMGHTNITGINGYFTIRYTINPNLDVYSSHKLEVIVTDPEPGGPESEIEYHHFYNIDVNATSYFDIDLGATDDPTIPKLTEEDFNIIGNLRFDNDNGIPLESVNYYWLEGTTIISSGSFPTDDLGSLMNLQVPITSESYLTLKFNYSNPPFVEYSEYVIPNIKVFSDIAWDLDIDYTTTEGVMYSLTGTLSSSTDSSLKINNREVVIYYNGTAIDTAITGSDGVFDSNFRIPQGNGTASIQVQLNEFVSGKDITSPLQYILVESAPPSNPGGGALPPFLIFSLIFFPILAGIVAVLAVYGYKYYKKQEEESRVVNIPLESKIINLKILKESGRLEESISYLFNAIYMDLINAKYNRIRAENETIRDFAIISVKELKLTPSSIYPFIQKVEEIIYAKPFKITEKDFYNTCELFSPVYFQLTGYNFVLNF